MQLSIQIRTAAYGSKGVAMVEEAREFALELPAHVEQDPRASFALTFDDLDGSSVYQQPLADVVSNLGLQGCQEGGWPSDMVGGIGHAGSLRSRPNRCKSSSH